MCSGIFWIVSFDWIQCHTIFQILWRCWISNAKKPITFVLQCFNIFVTFKRHLFPQCLFAQMREMSNTKKMFFIVLSSGAVKRSHSWSNVTMVTHFLRTLSSQNILNCLVAHLIHIVRTQLHHNMSTIVRNCDVMVCTSSVCLCVTWGTCNTRTIWHLHPVTSQKCHRGDLWCTKSKLRCHVTVWEGTKNTHCKQKTIGHCNCSIVGARALCSQWIPSLVVAGLKEMI